MSERLLISGGEVIEVQLTSETYVMAQGSGSGRKRRRKRGEAQPTGRIVNRMRVFVREPDGKERTYDFEGARLGVHDGHSVCVVRGRCEGGGKPVNLMLCNLSTEDRDLFEQQIVTFLDRKRLFGPFWHAMGLSAVLWVLFFLISFGIVRHGHQAITAGFYALFFAFLAFPVLWAGTGIWDRITERRRFKDGRAKLISDIEAHIAQLAPAAS
jgi:hypothetical protein